jgi:single stranded DNA-binding protein
VAKDTNIVVLTGNLVEDPKLSYAQELPIAKFRIASNYDNGKYKHTNYVNIKAIGKQAENVVKYLTKGRQVSITGELQLTSGKDEQTGVYWNFTSVNALPGGIIFLNGHEAAAKAKAAQDANPVPSGNDFVAEESPDTLPPSPFGASSEPVIEDDIPF